VLEALPTHGGDHEGRRGGGFTLWGGGGARDLGLCDTCVDELQLEDKSSDLSDLSSDLSADRAVLVLVVAKCAPPHTSPPERDNAPPPC
jgi:hypothetical protein